jgi:DNA-binding XRE family transcriptional regulator
MITAQRLKELTSIKKDALVAALEKGDNTPSWAYAIKKIKFLGLTNAGQFCYALDYDGRVAQRSYQARRPEKVFISLTPLGSLVVGT